MGGESRGIIASASYEARKFGIYTPMPTARARKLCPKLIVLPDDYERYEQFSSWMFGYAYDFTPNVEQPWRSLSLTHLRSDKLTHPITVVFFSK